MMRARLWRARLLCRINESSAFTLVVSQLVWTWGLSGKPNIYNVIPNPLTIEWE